MNPEVEGAPPGDPRLAHSTSEVAAFTKQVKHSQWFKLIYNLMKLKAIRDYSHCGLFLEDLLGKCIKGCGHFPSW